MIKNSSFLLEFDKILCFLFFPFLKGHEFQEHATEQQQQSSQHNQATSTHAPRDFNTTVLHPHSDMRVTTIVRRCG